MKTSIKNLFAAVLGLVVMSSSAFANESGKINNNNSAKEKNFTILNEVKNINKIVVSGNVEVFVVQAPTESVKVYDSYYSKNALVQQKDGVLRISSFEKEPLSVTVYVRNLTAIEAGDNATVKTFGKVSFLTLDVVLKDRATADINAKTVSLNTSVTDNASLKLSGSTEEHFALMGTSAKMSTGQFVAGTSDIKSIAPKYVAQAKVVAPTLESIAAAELAK
ncbi:DUF2807 domain-containing protein [Pedobacter sp.]|uniref:GIN domain-containing protein n=1 Tax=Pedobacter sp. TaxID=1411316 RepID=UPI0031DB8456